MNGMRTTLELDGDVLEAAKQQAKARGTSLGQFVSHVLRQSLAGYDGERRMRNGVPLFVPKPGERSDLSVVNALRDET